MVCTIPTNKSVTSEHYLNRILSAQQMKNLLAIWHQQKMPTYAACQVSAGFLAYMGILLLCLCYRLKNINHRLNLLSVLINSRFFRIWDTYLLFFTTIISSLQEVTKNRTTFHHLILFNTIYSIKQQLFILIYCYK